MVKEAIKKADVLIEALPYIERYQKKIFIIKYGGSILVEERVRRSVLEDIAFLRYMGVLPILVHGGGPNITERLKKHKIVSTFVDGMRVTDKFTLKVVEEELTELNQMIVKELNAYGALAHGVTKPAQILQATKKEYKKDLGLVGNLTGFSRVKLFSILKNAIPVISPIGVSKDGAVYNINADDVAFYLATKLKAEKLVLLTNVLGVMRDLNDDSSLISSISATSAEKLIKDGIIEKGMIPKVRAAVNAIKNGVGKAHIVDAKIPHALLLEIFTNEGIGTEIKLT